MKKIIILVILLISVSTVTVLKAQNEDNNKPHYTSLVMQYGQSSIHSEFSFGIEYDFSHDPNKLMSLVIGTNANVHTDVLRWYPVYATPLYIGINFNLGDLSTLIENDDKVTATLLLPAACFRKVSNDKKSLDAWIVNTGIRFSVPFNGRSNHCFIVGQLNLADRNVWIASVGLKISVP